MPMGVEELLFSPLETSCPKQGQGGFDSFGMKILRVNTNEFAILELIADTILTKAMIEFCYCIPRRLLKPNQILIMVVNSLITF